MLKTNQPKKRLFIVEDDDEEEIEITKIVKKEKDRRERKKASEEEIAKAREDIIDDDDEITHTYANSLIRVFCIDKRIEPDENIYYYLKSILLDKNDNEMVEFRNLLQKQKKRSGIKYPSSNPKVKELIVDEILMEARKHMSEANRKYITLEDVKYVCMNIHKLIAILGC